MTNEKIVINNFGGIVSVSAEINRINILIGPQASGKSIIAKMLFFCKSLFNQVIISAEQNNSKREFDTILINRFIDYFPLSCWPKNDFLIRYEIEDYFLELKREVKSNKKLHIFYSDLIYKDLVHYRRLINKIKSTSDEEYEVRPNDPYFRVRDKYRRNLLKKSLILTKTQYFIPAGRSFFANLQSSIFTFLSNNKAIDPFLMEFGSFYERMKDIENQSLVRIKDRYKKADEIIEEILTGKYIREKDKDFLVHEDGRKINLSYASSGQQESLPLAIILKYFANHRFRYGATIYIEEPEAHLFPQAQKKIVELISAVFNHTGNNYQFIITTHSPYILSSFNNLIQAGNIRKEIKEEKYLEKLFRLIYKDFILDIQDINSYSLKDGKLKPIIDSEYKLIEPNLLDSVSDDISIQFDSFLNL
jgi:predicted ATPase